MIWLSVHDLLSMYVLATGNIIPYMIRFAIKLACMTSPAFNIILVRTEFLSSMDDLIARNITSDKF